MVSIEDKIREYNWRFMGMNQRILYLIEERLKLGKEKYGKENIASDGRNFTIEALEEILDCCVYVAGKLLEIKEREDNGKTDK